MNKNISVFLPTRAGSERVHNKNTRTFAGIEGGLLFIKLGQLLEVSNINEVVLSTNDEESIKVAEKYANHPKLKIIKRPDELAQSSTNLSELVNYVPTVCSYDHILWTHVTSPLVNESDYEKAIENYFDHLKLSHDSLMSVKEIQNYIWSEKENKVTNKNNDDTKKWPRTQDLKSVFEVNSAIFITHKNIYKNEKDRIGNKPFLLKHNTIQSIDVDWEEDFKLAEIIYEEFN